MKKNLRRLFEETVARALSEEGRRAVLSATRCLNWRVAAKRPPPEPVAAWRGGEDFQRALERGKRQGDFQVFAIHARWRAFCIAVFRGCS